MANFFESKTFTSTDIEKKLEMFYTINMKVFKSFENEEMRKMCQVLLEAQKEALQAIFFGKNK